MDGHFQAQPWFSSERKKKAALQMLYRGLLSFKVWLVQNRFCLRQEQRGSRRLLLPQ